MRAIYFISFPIIRTHTFYLLFTFKICTKKKNRKKPSQPNYNTNQHRLEINAPWPRENLLRAETVELRIRIFPRCQSNKSKMKNRVER